MGKNGGEVDLTGHINFFVVNECGLYKNGDPNSHGLGLAETFDLIANWAGQRKVGDTLPWGRESSRQNSVSGYCWDIYKDEETDDFILVLWKSETGGAGGIWGAQQNTLPGRGSTKQYEKTVKGEPVLWGRPCYYWISPADNVVMSIKFEHSSCDSMLFQDWVSACITNRIDHPDKKRETTETGQVRLSFVKSNGEPSRRYRYGFNVSLLTLPTSGQELEKLAKRVTHIIRRETIDLATGKDERAQWLKLFDEIPYLAAKPKSQKRQIEVIAEARPSAREISEIIRSNARYNRKPTDWENVGFQTDEGATVWVDRYRLKSNISVVHDLSRGVIPATVLYDAIRAKRDLLLAQVKKSQRPSPVRLGVAG